MGTPEKFEQIRRIFDGAADLHEAQRDAFLEEACGGDRGLLAEVEGLLEADATGGKDLLTITAPGTSDPEPTKRTIGGYQLIHPIGMGGMAEVYLGHRVDDAEPVAVKLIKPGYDSEELIGRFHREQLILASLNHPNIARLLDAGNTDDGIPFVVMDLVEGIPIDRYCDTQRLPIAERLTLFATVCSAVQYAHDRGIIHRDLKPTNILVTPAGTPQVLDFGIGKLLKTQFSGTDDLTKVGRRLLTPGYASPEQILGRATTDRSDIYSLGVLLYELLIGRTPLGADADSLDHLAEVIATPPETPSRVFARHFDPVTATEVANQRATTPLRLRYQLRGDIDCVVLKSLAVDPEHRYGSVNQLREDLLRWLDCRPIFARRHSLGYVAGKSVTRRSITTFQIVKQAFSRPESSPHLETELDRISKLNSLGVVLAETGETTEALHNFEQALRIADEAALQHPDEPAVWRAISISCNRMGSITTRIGNPHAALKLFRKALFVNELLIANEPTDGACGRNVVGNSKNVAVVYEILASDVGNNWNARIRYLEMARTWYRRALETSFEMQRKGLATKREESSPIELAYSLKECEDSIGKLRTLHLHNDPTAES
jgi:serine/threonine protein kinase